MTFNQAKQDILNGPDTPGKRFLVELERKKKLAEQPKDDDILAKLASGPPPDPKAEPARFAMPLARIGLVVPFTLGQKLVEIVGPAHTRHLLLTGRSLPARRAWEIGMVHEVVPAAGSIHSAVRINPLRMAEIVGAQWVDVCDLRA